MKRLTNLVLLIMKSLPKINEIYLNYIKDNEELYSLTPIEVKRQIWCLNSGKLRDNYRKTLHFKGSYISQ